MRIAVSARLLIKDRLEGMGVFANEILSRVTRAHPECTFYFLFDRKPGQEFLFGKNVIPVIVAPQARHPILWRWWLHRCSGYIKKLKPDLFFSPDGFVPDTESIPVLNVVHDLNFEYLPHLLPPSVRNYYKKNFPVFVKRSHQLCTVSAYSASTLQEKYGIDPQRVRIIPNAAAITFRPLDPALQEKVRSRFSASKPYFLYVGSLNPRKNIEGMIRAYIRLREKTGRDVQLVLVGEGMHGTAREKLLKGVAFKNDIHFTGRLSTSTLAEVMASALALVYVPFFEGFGIPVIEAMQSGTPVITSNSTSLPEVAGEAALYADPGNPEDISGHMERILNDESLRSALMQKGKVQAAQFSWDRSAAHIWDLMHELTQRK